MYLFPDLHNTEVFKSRGNSYAQEMVEDTVAAFSRNGLPIEFAEMATACISDLNLVIFDEKETENPKAALLDVVKVPDKNHPEGSSYKRLMLISEQEIKRRAIILALVFRSVNMPYSARKERLAAATDWVFYEMAMASLGTACYMQQTFPKYVPDWNGTDKYNNAHRTISQNYLTLNPDEKIGVREDTRRLIKGFGITMLHNSLLVRGITTRATQATWAVGAIRRLYPLAYKGEEIEQRLSAVKPTEDIDEEVADFSSFVFDPDVDMEIDITRDF